MLRKDKSHAPAGSRCTNPWTFSTQPSTDTDTTTATPPTTSTTTTNNNNVKSYPDVGYGNAV